MMLPSGKKTKSDDGSVDMGSRIISFGNMPSYREDKIKKMQRNQGMNTISQSESEHSHGDRESTEVKVPPQNLTLPLAKAPEKGILKKKYPRSADDIAALAKGRGSQVMNDEGEEEEPEEPEEPEVEEEEEVDDGEELDDEKGSISEQSDYTDDDDDDEKKEFTPTPSDEEKSLGEDEDTQDKGAQSPQHSGSSSPNSKPPSRDSSKDSIAGARNRIRRLKNIDELIRQIDEHMSQLSASPDPTERNLSPANSDELPGSETEVDRHYPRDSFYHLSDVDDSVSAGQPSTYRSGSSPTQPRSPSTLPQSSPSLPHAPSPSIPQSITSSPSPLSPLAPHLQLPLLASWPSSRDSNSPGDLRSLAKKSPNRSSAGSQSPARHSGGSRSPSKRSPTGGTPERQGSPRRSPFRHGSPTKSDKSDGQFSPIKKPSSPIKEPPRHQSAPIRQPYSHVRQCSPARQPNTGMENPNKVGKIPDIPTSPSRARRANNADPGHDRASPGKVPPEPPPRNPQLHKLINPLLDSYLMRRPSLTTDGQSNSEGYHSDRTGDDETIIIREIPVVKPGDAQYLSPKQTRYTKTTPTTEGEETIPV